VIGTMWRFGGSFCVRVDLSRKLECGANLNSQIFTITLMHGGSFDSDVLIRNTKVDRRYGWFTNDDDQEGYDYKQFK
jgi:hypothetical protein